MVHNEEFISLNIFLFTLILTICIGIDIILKKYKILWLPESVAMIFVGFIIGLCITFTSDDEVNVLIFNSEIFFYILLPPIVFDAGYSLKKKNFFKNIGAILLYAVLGTVVSCTIIAFILYGFALKNLVPLDNTSPFECLVFGALISSTDPVATLNIISSKNVNAPPLLHALIFGESVLNDAISIVLFKTFESFLTTSNFGEKVWLIAIGNFLLFSVGSTLIGLIFALLLSFITKHIPIAELSDPHFEITLIMLFASASYFMSELLGLSGIFSLFFCGVALSHYTHYNISDEARNSSHLIFKSLAQVSEVFLFIYMGVTAGLAVDNEFSWSISLISAAIFSCIISRAVNIFGFSLIANFFRKKNQIPFGMQVVMWFSGLRGAIAFALSLTVISTNSKYMVTTTFTIVFITSVFCAVLTEPLMRYMKMRGVDLENSNQTHLLDKNDSKSRSQKWWRQLDHDYIKPLFGGDVSLPPNFQSADELLDVDQFTNITNSKNNIELNDTYSVLATSDITTTLNNQL